MGKNGGKETQEKHMHRAKDYSSITINTKQLQRTV